MRTFFSAFILLSSIVFGQNSDPEIYKIENLDSALIGKKVKFAILALEIDTNWRIIFEPSNICRGIQTENIENCEIQIYIERGSVPPYKVRNTSKNYSSRYRRKLRSQKIIGVSWRIGGNCGSYGQVISYYAYDRFGPCG